MNEDIRSGKYETLAQNELVSVSVTDNIEVSEGVRLLKFPRTFDFSPGQSIGVTVERRIAPRLYSIASGPGEQFIDLLYDLVPAGELTPRLSQLRTGDLLFAAPPSGDFLDDESPGFWIATGTGIAPFVSMAKAGLSGRKRLIHGSRTLSAFHFRKYFSQLLGERYLCCCSQERADGVFAGRLSEWLAAQRDLPRDQRYLLCGGAQMVVEVRDLLIAKGVPYGSIQSEIYF